MAGEIFRGVSEAGHVLARQVDAAFAEIDGEVLPEVRELERGADVVGARLALGVGVAEEVQHEVADRVRGVHAVVHELVERREAGEAHVHAERGEQPLKRLDRDRERPHGVGERDEDRDDRDCPR
jgi:hypothetical protein